MDQREDEDQTTTPRRRWKGKRAQSPIDVHTEEFVSLSVHSNSTTTSTPFSMTAPTLPSSSETHWKYDLFMSYRSEDTRKTFVDHLDSALVRMGIDVYRDDMDLPRRERISDELLKAIEKSKIDIVIFSEGYGVSKECLDGLEKILDCMKTEGSRVITIFYDMNPSDVRNQTGTFAEAFARHAERFGRDKVQRWREALVELANIPGWDNSDENGSESMLVEKVVSKVLYLLNKNDCRVEEIKTLLNLGTSDVCIVGIFGMAGMGKTTLAKAVYDQVRNEFEGSSFLSNIREKSKEPNGLAHLQEQLLSDILNTKDLKIDNVDKGIILMKQKLQCKRVLVVLDDVDEMIQLEVLAGCSEWFGPRSIVIATTRDGYLLNQMQVNAKYRVEMSTYLEYLPLFVWKALNIPPPIEHYRELLNGATLAEATNQFG